MIGANLGCFSHRAISVMSKNWGKHSFCHWDHDPVSVVKMGQKLCICKKVSEYDQEIPQPHTVDM